MTLTGCGQLPGLAELDKRSGEQWAGADLPRGNRKLTLEIDTKPLTSGFVAGDVQRGYLCALARL